MPEVAALQGWIQAMIVEGASGGAREHVRGNNRLTAEAQLGIYAQAYRLRLLECLRTEYPVLAALAGPTAFDLFAQGYIAAHPSRSYTLYNFGAGFADYLEDVRPAGDGSPQTVEAIPAALARIERAKAEVQRARGVERDSPDMVETGFDPVMTSILGLGLSAARAWRRPDSVRLLTLAFDFTETLACAERGEAPVLPVAAQSHFAVSRAQYRVECRRLEPWQYDWLAALPCEEGESIPEANPDPRLTYWLAFAVDHGLALPAA
jgi:hypothetical protein